MVKTVKPLFKRVLLKLSGEALSGDRNYGIDPQACSNIAERIKEVRGLGIEVAVVIGGGNIIRGEKFAAKGMDRSTADYMGMLATVINSMALQDALEKIGCFTRVQTAIQMEQIAERYIRLRAISHLEKGRVVIFAGGTGNPYFTTDTAAVLRAVEVCASVILKATKVDGIYTADPVVDKHAKKYDKLKYIEVINKGLKVMDTTAISLCMDNHLPIVVFNVNVKGNIKRACLGEKVGTIVS